MTSLFLAFWKKSSFLLFFVFFSKDLALFSMDKPMAFLTLGLLLMPILELTLF